MRQWIFPLVSFSHGILSHLSLRENNDQYLKETKGMAKVGEVCSLLPSYQGGFLFGRVKIP